MPRKKKPEQPKEPSKFEIPNAFLEQLNEFSGGGFLMFSFDEDGNPQMSCNFDSIPHATAMHTYILSWAKAVAEINHSITKQVLLSDNFRNKRKK